LVLSLLPWLAVAAIPFLDVSAGLAAGIAGTLIVSAEVVFVLAIMVLGKDAYDRLRRKLRMALAHDSSSPDHLDQGHKKRARCRPP